MEITNSKFEYQGYYGNNDLGIYTYAPVFSFRIRKPYMDLFSSLITETIYFNNLTLYDCYGGDGAHFVSFIYETTATE